MARNRRSSKGRTGGRGRFPRTARLNQLVQEIVAEELGAIDDERLGLLTIVAVEVEGDLGRATAWFTTLSGDEADDTVLAALEEHRARLQAAVGRQARIRRTPELVFRPDEMTRQAERVEEILREIAPPADDEPS
jgi:ribosome-binding factor A